LKKIFLGLFFLTASAFAEEKNSLVADSFCTTKADQKPLVVKERSYEKERYFTICDNESCNNILNLQYYIYTRLYLSLNKKLDVSCLKNLLPLPNKNIDVINRDVILIISDFTKKDLENLLTIIQDNPNVKIVSFNRANVEVNAALNRQTIKIPPSIDDIQKAAKQNFEDINSIISEIEKQDTISSENKKTYREKLDEKLKKIKIALSDVEQSQDNKNLVNTAIETVSDYVTNSIDAIAEIMPRLTVDTEPANPETSAVSEKQ
jgi:hypothetical protein